MKWIVGMLMVLSVLCCAGCREGDTAKTLDGECKLHKMRNQSETHTELSGGFFLFAGGVSVKSIATSKIQFAWQTNDGAYVISSLPLEKIRVKIDDKVEARTIRFEWARHAQICHYEHSDRYIDNIMNQCIIYAVVTVHEEDWPANVTLPMN